MANIHEAAPTKCLYRYKLFTLFTVADTPQLLCNVTYLSHSSEFQRQDMWSGVQSTLTQTYCSDRTDRFQPLKDISVLLLSFLDGLMPLVCHTWVSPNDKWGGSINPWLKLLLEQADLRVPAKCHFSAFCCHFSMVLTSFGIKSTFTIIIIIKHL